MRNKIEWKQSEIDYMKRCYADKDTDEICVRILKTKQQVITMAWKLGIRKNNYQEWSINEVEKLRMCYPSTLKKEIIREFPNRTWEKIKAKAIKEGIKRNTKGMDAIQADLSVLLEDTKISAYWLGFLLADGHFSKNNRLKLTLAEKDYSHVKEFANFIRHVGKIKYNKKSYEISVMDNFNVKNIKNKFNICSTKTYSPPKLTVFKDMKNDYFISMLIGFIDGDGSIAIRKNGKFGTIAVKCHSAWLNNLNYFINRLNSITNLKMPIGKLNARGYARVFITNRAAAKFLKQKSIEFSLPVLNRKWEKLNQPM